MVYGQLHQLIEQSKWVTLLQSIEHDSSLFDDAKEEHRHQLPLHMVCERRAPDDVILAILDCYPDACKWKGERGNLPLHIATLKRLSEDIIESLVRVYPEALEERNEEGQTPREIAGSSDLPSLRRPTCCFHQLIETDAWEEAHDEKLKEIHSKVDEGIHKIQAADEGFQKILTRLETVERQLDILENNPPKVTDNAELNAMIDHLMRKFEFKLALVEDDMQAATAREAMAKVASRAHQSQILRLQKKTSIEARKLRQEVEEFRRKLESKERST
jgi:hypothetical protein